MTQRVILPIVATLLALFASSCASSSADYSAHIVGKDKFGMPQYNDKAKLRSVRTTAYHCGECYHIEYGSKSAAGTPLRYGNIRSAAADWSRYPLGTKFKIKGLPFTYVIDDYGSALVGTNTIDLYKRGGDREMRWWGVRKVEINVLEVGDYDLSERILRDRRRHAHCRKMHDNLQRRLVYGGGSSRNAG